MSTSKSRLPSTGLLGRDRAPYHAHPDLITAANVALALHRPLLLTGEPGCGKTDFAYAAARALAGRGAEVEDSGLLEAQIRSDSQARDLLYHYDALRRFGDAHHGGEAGRALAEDPRNYIQLLALGQGLCAPGLEVVLLDEIDKAPRDLPNDLLRELDHGCFDISEIPARIGDHPSGLRRRMGRASGDPGRPLVIVTSNTERQLPDPFLRRCVFYHIEFPDEARLGQILQGRFPGRRLERLEGLLDVFLALRKVEGLTKRPATSELIDWGRALFEVLGEDAAWRQLGLITDAMRKQGDPSKLPWARLPAASCLVKLREDREFLGLSARS